MKILLIEDDRELREVIAASLRQARFVVESAATLVDARTKVAAYEYDCILLDIMLPDGSGLDLLREFWWLEEAWPSGPSSASASS